MVEWKKIGEVLTVHTGKQLNRSGLSEVGKYPVINGGRTPSGYTDSYNENKNSITISQGGESAGFVNWVDTAFWAGAHCYVVENTTNQNLRFLFHLLKNYEYGIMESKQGAGIPGLNRKNLYSILIPIPSLEEQKRIVGILDTFTDSIENLKQIPIPSLEEQKRIVGILDTFTDSIENLKQQIAQRRKQYEHYRDQLLDLEGKDGVEMKVSDFCLLKAGKGISASEIKDVKEDGSYSCFGGNGIRGFVTFYSHEGKFPIIGRQGALCGCVAWASGKFYATEHAVVASGKENTNQRFLFYLFQQANLNQYKSQGAQPGLSVAKLNELLFRIPPLSEQQRIVSILDTFEASISNLEAQLEQRQKQYEYYRNQLLTFE